MRPQSEPQSTGGASTARALADHFDRLIAGSQQVLLERISRQDAVLARQQDLLESLSRVVAASRAESRKENETIKTQLYGIEKKTDRLSKGIGESMKLFATGAIRAITECQTAVEESLFGTEESCEGIKEELRDPQANIPEVVRHEISPGSDLPIQTNSYRDAAITSSCYSEISLLLPDSPPERVLCDVEEMSIDSRQHSKHDDPSCSWAGHRAPSRSQSFADGVDNQEQPLSSFEQLSYGTVNPMDTFRVPGPSRMLNSSFDIDFDGSLDTDHYERPFTTVPDRHREFTSDSLGLIHPSNPSHGHSPPPTATLESDYMSSPAETTTSSIRVLDDIVPSAGETREASLVSLCLSPASASLDSRPGSAQASTISLPEPSALLIELFGQPKNKRPQVSGPTPVTVQFRPLSRAESLSSLSSLSAIEAPILHNQTLSVPAPSNRRRGGTSSGVLTSPRKRRRSSPGPKRRKAAKKRRTKKSGITKKVKELTDENNTCNRAASINVSSANTTDRQFIQCDNCELWYHWGCVGIRRDDLRLKDGEIFDCPPCQHGKTPAASSLFKGQADICSWPDCDLGNDVVEEYFIERLIGRYDTRGAKDRFSWLVKWEGYPAEEATWTPAGELTNPAKLTKEFELAAEAEGLVLSRSALNLLSEAVESGWANTEA